MNKWRVVLALAVALVLGQQLVAGGVRATAPEADRLAVFWSGAQADIRLVVYDDMNANFNRRKVAYHAELSDAQPHHKALVQGLRFDAAQPHCDESTPIYVLEIHESGHKRSFSSDNNQCRQGAKYVGYVPAEQLAQLARAMRAQQDN